MGKVLKVFPVSIRSKERVLIKESLAFSDLKFSWVLMNRLLRSDVAEARSWINIGWDRMREAETDRSISLNREFEVYLKKISFTVSFWESLN